MPFPRLANSDSANAALWTLLAAALCFGPFLTTGAVLIGNTDVYLVNFPLLSFVHDHLGESAFWNPFILGGTSTFGAAAFHLFAPELWPALLAPKSWVLPILTVLQLLKLAATGWASFIVFRTELDNSRWALFASVALTLSGYAVYVTTGYEAMASLLYVSLTMAVVATAQSRSMAANYLTATLLIAATLASGVIHFSVYGLLSVGLYTLLRAVRMVRSGNRADAVRLLTVFGFAALTGLGIAMVRLLPTWLEIKLGGTNADCCRPTWLEAPFLLLRLFSPEIFGVHYQSSQSLFRAMYSYFDGWHIHAQALNYFGTTIMALVLWGMLTPDKPLRLKYWAVYALVVLTLIANIPPFHTIFYLLLTPLVHVQSIHILAPFPILLVAALAGASLERTAAFGDTGGRTLRHLLLVLYLIYGSFLSILSVQSFEATGPLPQKIAAIVLLGLPLGLAWWVRRHRVTAARIAVMVFTSAGAVSVITAAGLVFKVNSVPNGEFHLNLAVSLALLLGNAGWLAARLATWPEAERRILRMAWGVVPLAVVAVALPWTKELILISPTADLIQQVGGIVRFAVIGLSILMLVTLLRDGGLDRRAVLPILAFMMLAELAPAWRVNSHIVVNPFQSQASLYPERSISAYLPPASADDSLGRWRINNPDAMLSLPFYLRHWGSREILASLGSFYGIRSYGGYWNVISDDFDAFLARFIKKGEYDRHGVYANQTDPRFLDLLGVRYDYDPATKQVSERPGALARFMLFHRWDSVQSQTAALDRITDPGFDPLGSVVVESPAAPMGSPDGRAARILNGTELSPDHIQVTLDAGDDGIILFNDRFHPGWSARVDGIDTPIRRADSTFMAISVPRGALVVDFTFRPPGLRLGAIIAATTTLVMILLALLLWHRRALVDLSGMRTAFNTSAS